MHSASGYGGGSKAPEHNPCAAEHNSGAAPGQQNATRVQQNTNSLKFPGFASCRRPEVDVQAVLL